MGMGAGDTACAEIAEKQFGLISRDPAIRTGMSAPLAEGWARADSRQSAARAQRASSANSVREASIEGLGPNLAT